MLLGMDKHLKNINNYDEVDKLLGDIAHDVMTSEMEKAQRVAWKRLSELGETRIIEVLEKVGWEMLI